jgi:23S rRNA (uracil1939-C5)-methyltransferase
MENNTQKIISLTHDAKGIAEINGKKTFIFNALINEEVEISYNKKHSKYDEAKAINITSHSKDRVTPKCKHYNICGGCSMQHISGAAQINHKQNMLLEHLLHFGGVKPKYMLSALISEPYYYRRKARLSVKNVYKKQQVLVGFRERFNPRLIANIDSCAVLDPKINLLALQILIAKLEANSSIAQIEIAIGDNVVAYIFRNLVKLSESDEQLLKEFAELNNSWIYLQPKGYDSIYRLYPDNKEEYLYYDLFNNLKIYFHPSDFTQNNFTLNKLMVKQALELLDLKPNDCLLDLFCGVGNFSLAAAKYCKKVIGIEGDFNMTKRAYMNAAKNDIINAEFIAADLTKFITSSSTNNITSCNKLLLDPPRTGAKEFLENNDLNHIETVVYVSCNPATLARDAGILIKNGFVLKSAGVMDMFPQTSHVEAMALFERI